MAGLPPLSSPFPFLPFPSFPPFLSLPLFPFTFLTPSPPLKSRSLLFQLGVWLQPKSILVHFSLKIWHVVATILMIFKCLNFIGLAWRRHTKFQIGMAAAVPACHTAFRRHWLQLSWSFVNMRLSTAWFIVCCCVHSQTTDLAKLHRCRFTNDMDLESYSVSELWQRHHHYHHHEISSAPITNGTIHHGGTRGHSETKYILQRRLCFDGVASLLTCFRDK